MRPELNTSLVAIRVDASTQIGTGHFMRCLTLADALTKSGLSAHFVSRQLPDYLKSLLLARHHGFTLIGSDADPPSARGELAHADWLGTTQQRDAEQTLAVLAGSSWAWLIVDHYALDYRWEKSLRHVVGKIAVIDDIADRMHDCDVLLDQNYYENATERYAELLPKSCVVLLGPAYALLREEFRELREEAKARSGTVKRVLVFFGGADKEDFTTRAVQALAMLRLPDLMVDVVVGQQHPHLASIQNICASNAFSFHVQTSQIGALMLAADLAIGAGGIALWERCCLGLPTFVIPTAENQKKQTVHAANVGLIYAPQLDRDDTEEIGTHFQILLQNPSLIRSMSKSAMAFVDGSGVRRGANRLIGNLIHIRHASFEDSLNLFTWRNQAYVREVSRNKTEIQWDQHQKWLNSVMISEDKHLLIGEISGNPVGVVRFDIVDEVAEVSIYLVSKEIGHGLGAALLGNAEKWLVKNISKIRRIDAIVLDGNNASKNLFLNAGYGVRQMQFSKEFN